MTPSPTLSNPALLQKIDELRERNIGQHVPLPQLVVVGDQSSGKSSLLESLTGIPFPRNLELCTRHATQITSRRDTQARVEVRIIPGPQASEEDRMRQEAYIETMSSSNDLRSRFLEILKKANEKMGIREDLSLKFGTVFSEAVLKIEICGPKEDYLTIIDVPGIFRNHTEGITTKQDIELVNNLVRRYIKDKRTIILAVLPSNVDIATQEIIALAETYDKNGERTLGVLTKPDLVTESSQKISVCNLVSGKRRPLSLGYYLVRNRGADDESKVGYNAREKMFEEEPWCTLSPERVGIPALKKQLETLLGQITRREFPILRREIQLQAENCQQELDSIGPARPNEKEQRGFLSDLARRFEDLKRGALDADYINNRLFREKEARLITRLVNLTEVFSESFRIYGQRYHFESIGSSSAILLPEENEDEDEDDDDETSHSWSPFNFHDYLDRRLMMFGGTDISDYRELDGIVSQHIEIEDPQRGIMDWIKNLYLQSRGMDMGTFSPNLLTSAFEEQSRQWDKMVQVYMGEVVRLIHHFMTMALRSICPDQDLENEIWSAILDPILQKYKSGIEQAKLLVDIERYYRLYSLNGSFTKDIQQARAARAMAALKSKAWRSKSSFAGERVVVNLDDVGKVAADKTNQAFLEEEIHDKLHSYYYLAVDRVIDNIFRQAVYYHLLKGPESPLEVFSQRWVIDLNPDVLEAIAGETQAVKKRREVLTKKKKNLSQALDILRS